MEAERALAYATVCAEDDLALAGNGPAAFAGRPLALAFALGLAASSVDAFLIAPAPPAGGGGGPLPDAISACIGAGPGLADRLLLVRLGALAGISESLTGMRGGF